jgi:hypothetical protein
MDQGNLDSKRYPVPFPWNSKASGIGRLSLVVVVLIFTSGCMNMKFKAGKQIDPGVIDKTFHLKESTTTDVLNVLGEPFGKGKAMLPVAHETSRTMWTYFYEQGDMKDSRGMYLFVFFDQDRYDGYMWFSSLPSDIPK